MSNPSLHGAIVFHILLAGVLTLVVGVVLLARYRRAVQRWMGGISPRRSSAEPVSVASTAGASSATGPALGTTLAIEVVTPSDAMADHRLQSPTMRAATRSFFRAAFVYGLAGLSYAAVATGLLMGFGGIGFLPIRTAAVFCAQAWPVVLMLCLFWGPDRRHQTATFMAYLAVLAAIAIIVGLGDTRPLPLATVPAVAEPAAGTESVMNWARDWVIPAFAQPLLVWLMYALPTGYLLLFANRRVRAIGPALLLMMLIAVAGIHLATLFLGSTLGFGAFAIVAETTSIGASVWFYGLQVVGLLMFLIPGWFGVAWLARRYDRKQMSDQTLLFDAIWLFATLLLCQSLIFDVGPVGWTGLLAFGAYKLVSTVGLAGLAQRARRRPPARLLLLRVFGFQRRTERFLAILSARWRYAGSIQLIAATDLATSTIEPGEFLTFLSGKLRRLFIGDPADIERRFAHIDTRPDPDGRFRVNEFFCTDAAWRDVALRLMRADPFVVMDLRGFAPTNRGCLFELQALLDGVPLAALALLVDHTTDLAYLRETLNACWKRLSAASPNRDAVNPRLCLLQTSGNGATAVRALFALADQRLISTGVESGFHLC